MEVLLQLLNPAFPQKVKIYHDPLASETSKASIGGFTVAGRADKSYYAKIGDDVAYRIAKKTYDDDKPKVFSDCPDFYGTMKANSWNKFPEVLFNYSKECK